MAICRSRLASFSSEPAKPTLCQASIENSDPTIAAPITGHSAAPRPPAGQNPGPKFASIAAALRPIVIPRRMSAASAVVLMAVSDVWMTAAVFTPRTLIPVNTITERIARSRWGESPTWMGPLPRLIVVPRKTSGEGWEEHRREAGERHGHGGDRPRLDHEEQGPPVQVAEQRRDPL